MSSRNQFTSITTTHELLDSLVRGHDWTIDEVSSVFDVQYAQARSYLKFLEERYELTTELDGRTKIWSWPHSEGEWPAGGVR